MIDMDDDGETWLDHWARSGGMRHPGNSNQNDDDKDEQDMQGGENGPEKGKCSMDGQGKGKGKKNCKGKVMIKQTPGGDDISRAITL